MPISDKIKEALKNELLKARPLMDLERVHKEVFKWLSEINSPYFPDSEAWKKNVKIFPPEDNEKEEATGSRVRLAVTLYTRENQYLITIIENLEYESRDVYIISAIVNWSGKERQKQQQVDMAYTGQFKDTLRSRHTLWAQTFQIEELRDALNNCTTAILGNELVEKKESEIESIPLSDIFPHNFDFPKADKDKE
ncbi:MAG: hypothetical protein ACOYVF_05940 [Candidatus Zixiibacteriota bacterium]